MADLPSNTNYGSATPSPMGNLSSLLKTMNSGASNSAAQTFKSNLAQFHAKTAPPVGGDPTRAEGYTPPKPGIPLAAPTADSGWIPPQQGSWVRNVPSFLGGGQRVINPKTGESATVLRILDGDTIGVDLGDGKETIVRYQGMNTPEIPHSPEEKASKSESWWGPGYKAAGVNAEMLPVGSRVTLESDVTNQDKYGRDLRYVRPENKGIAGQSLMQQGQAVPMQFPADIKYPGRNINGRTLSKAELDILKKRGLPSSSFTVDYIAPLWADGRDTLANRQIISNKDYAKKMAIQAVPLTLFVNGQFSGTTEQQRSQATVMAMSWKNKDASGLPTLEELNQAGGYVPLDMAKKYVEKWKADETPSMWSQFKGSLAENIKGFLSPRMLGNVADTLGTGIPGQNTQSLSNQSLFMSTVGEAGKGFAGGLSAEIVPHTEASPESGDIGWWSNLAGNLLGMGIGLGKVALAGRGLRGANEARKAFQGATKGASLVDTMWNGFKSGLNVSKIAGASDVKQVTKWFGVGSNVKTNALLFAVWGQIGLAGKELTGQEEFDLGNIIKTATHDALFGGVLGATSRYGSQYSATRFGTIGATMTSFALMDQYLSGQPASIEDALKNGILMAGLHGLGYRRGRLDPRDAAISDAGFNMSSTIANKFVPIIPQVSTGEVIPRVKVYSNEWLEQANATLLAAQKKYPRDASLKGLKPVDPKDPNASGNALDNLERVAQKNALVFHSKITGGGGAVSPERVDSEQKAIKVAFNVLKIRTLPEKLQPVKEMNDWHSEGDIMRNQMTGDQARPAYNSRAAIEKLLPVSERNAIPQDVAERYRDAVFTEGSSSVRTSPNDVETMANREHFAEHPGEYTGKLFHSLGEINATVGRTINAEFMADPENKGKPLPIEDPENIITTFAEKKDGTYSRIGFGTENRGLDRVNNPEHINQWFDKIMARIQATIKKATTPAEMIELLSKDRAMGDKKITKKLAQKLLDKNDPEFFDKDGNISDQKLYKVLDPTHGQTEHTIANSSMAKNMREHGLSVLVTDARKVFPKNGTEPRDDPNHSYIDYEVTRNDYIRSAAAHKTLVSKAGIKRLSAKFAELKKTIPKQEETAAPEPTPDFSEWSSGKKSVVKKEKKTQQEVLKTELPAMKEKKAKREVAAVETAKAPRAADMPQKASKQSQVESKSQRVEEASPEEKNDTKSLVASITPGDGERVVTTETPQPIPPNQSNEIYTTNESERVEHKTTEKTELGIADEFGDFAEPPNPGKYVPIRIGREQVNDVAARLVKDPKKQQKFTKDVLTAKAKKFSEGGEDFEKIAAGFEKFKDDFLTRINKAIPKGDDKYTMDKDDTERLYASYVSMARGFQRNQLVVTNGVGEIVPGGLENMGELDIRTKQLNRKFGFDENDMEILNLNPNNNYKILSNNPNYIKSAVSDVKVAEEFLSQVVDKNGNIGARYMAVGKAGKNGYTTHFVKINDELGEFVDKNPGKYMNKDEVFEGNQLEIDDAKFMRAYLVEYMNVPKESLTNKIMPRANLLYNRNDVYLGGDQPIALVSLAAKKVGDFPEFNIKPSSFGGGNTKLSEKAVESYHGTKKHDGFSYLEESAYDKHKTGTPGYRFGGKHDVGMKMTVSATVPGPDGEPLQIYHKTQVMRMNDEIRKDILADYPDFKFEKNQMISFDTNGKIGPKTGRFEIQLKDLFPISLSSADSVSRDSPSRRIKMRSTDVGVTEAMVAQRTPIIEELSKFNLEVHNTRSKEEFARVLAKWKERFPKLDTESLFQGTKKKNFDLGAAKYLLQHEMSKMLKNLYEDQVINPYYKNSAMITIAAPIRGNYDGSGVYRHPKGYPEDPASKDLPEIVLSAEQIKALHRKEGDQVALIRDPSYNINNIVIAKLVNGTKSGNTSLGMQYGMMHPEVERVREQGDQDGDPLNVIAIGEGGISQAEADAILRRGRLATPFEEVVETKSPTITPRSMSESIADDNYGADQTSAISVVTRIHEEVVDNGIRIHVFPRSGKQSAFEIFAKNKDGKHVKVWDGHTDPQEDHVTFFPRGDFDTPEYFLVRDSIEGGHREAVDSKKSNQIKETTDGRMSWALETMWSFDGVKDMEKASRNDIPMTSKMAASLRGALAIIQKPHGLKKKFADKKIKSLEDIYEGIITSKSEGKRIPETGLSATTLRYYRNLRRAGVPLTPQQTVHLLQNPKNKKLIIGELKEIGVNLSPERQDLLDFSKDPQTIIADLEKTGITLSNETREIISRPGLILFTPEQRDLVAADKAGGRAAIEAKVRGDFGVIPKELASKKMKHFLGEMARVKSLFITKKKTEGYEALEKLNIEFLDAIENKEITQKEVDSLAYSVATMPSGNIKHGQWAIDNKKDPFYVQRFEAIMAESPSVMRAYNAGAEAYDPNIEKVADSLAKVNPKPPTAGGAVVPKPEAPKPVMPSGKVKTKQEQLPFPKKPDGKGGAIGDAWGKLKSMMPSNTITYTAASMTPKTPTYNVRGLPVTDKDLDEASKVIGLEISNRPGKDQFETNHIVNTAINRALTGPKQWGSNLTEVLQKPSQYQAYAPAGVVTKGGHVAMSRYQQLQQGTLNAGELAKIKRVRDHLETLKKGDFPDTTGGATFYAHATDGTMWVGKTQVEVKKLVAEHEKKSKTGKTQWGAATGSPAQN